jgi:hypothetical protein
MNIKYEYEVETYDLGPAGYYLPDFWLPHYKTWIEVKGVLPSEKEKEKLRALTEMTESYGFIFSGQIEVPGINDLIAPTSRKYARTRAFSIKAF